MSLRKDHATDSKLAVAQTEESFSCRVFSFRFETLRLMTKRIFYYWTSSYVAKREYL
jgi:hypothetical protein